MEAKNHHGENLMKRDILERKLAASAWALFFIWMGIAVFADVGWGVGLFGVGILTLGAQAARKYFAVRVIGFWVAVGLFFLLAGLWELLHVQLNFFPILCIALGFFLLVTTLMRKRGDCTVK